MLPIAFYQAHLPSIFDLRILNNPAGNYLQNFIKMKKSIPLLGILFGSFVVQNCAHEELEFETYKIASGNVKESQPTSYSSRQDSTKSKVSDLELEPDPPVKDTHDWRKKP